MFAALQTENNTQHLWMIAAGLGIGLLAIMGVVVYLMRKFFQSTRDEHKKEFKASAPSTENPSAFMAASMQGVIQQLREQEKELERLHRIEKERAEQTERLSEEVTRNMPAGLLVVNAMGIISSSNPAAEQVLGIRGLAFRRYSEALGASSRMTKLIGECLSSGKIFRREEVEHVPPAGDTRHLGVTISPIRRGEGKISGAICLLTEFLKYARPLEISDERVALQTMVERVVAEVGETLPQVRIRWEGTFGDAEGDEGLLRQALLNLARNAAEACAIAEGGGQVVVRGDAIHGEEAEFQRISVADNGPGIPANVLPKLFRPFFTTKAKGTGLGLAVVQKIVVQHGGQVQVRNRPEGGAEFIVTLPMPRGVPEAVESKQVSIYESV